MNGDTEQRQEIRQRCQGCRARSVPWYVRRHQLLPDPAQGLRNRKINSLLDQRSQCSHLPPPPSPPLIFPVRFKGGKCSEKPMWERVNLLPGSPTKLSRLLSSPLRLQMTVGAPICVGCDLSPAELQSLGVQMSGWRAGVWRARVQPRRGGAEAEGPSRERYFGNWGGRLRGW